MRNHYTVEQWDSFIEGTVSSAEKDKIIKHMESCEICRVYYEALLQIKNHMEVTDTVSDNFNGKVMDLMDKNKYKNKKNQQGYRRGMRALKPVFSVMLILLCLGLSFYIGTKYDLIQKNVAQQPEETMPIGVTEKTGETQPTQAPVLYENITLTLYFPNLNADSMVPAHREVRVAEGEQLERIIFEELRKGPEGDGENAMIPEGSTLLSIKTVDEVCTLDLSTEFVDNNPGGTAFESLLIGTIVNSLTELPHVKKVQFLIEGEKREVYSHVIFNEPFERSENIIRMPENTSEAIEEKVREQGTRVLEALRDKDMRKLSTFVHPDKGVRLTPYSYVEINEDRVFSAEEIQNALDDTTIYTWGVYDGIGDPINLTFSDYLPRFVYDEDFINAPEIGYNRSIGKGNTLNNVFEAYPEGNVIEYHFPEFDPEFVGMDWRSLRLVFEEKESIWYLVGIIHDEWTI